MAYQYDVAIIGGGSTGQSVATAAAGAGKSVAIAEGRAYGGTCPLRGCDPKLVLHAAAKASWEVQRLIGKGFHEAPAFTWADLMKWKETFTEPIPRASREKLKEAGVEVYREYAAFVDPHTLKLGDVEITAETIVIATGMQPSPLDIPGKEHLLTSDDFLEMKDLPDEVAIIGGGYIGAETAHICDALGAKIDAVITEDVPLDKFDHDLSKLMRKSDEERGMTFHMNSKATAVAREGDRYRVTIEDKDGNESEFTTDRVIHCAGRSPILEPLELDRAGVDYDKKKGVAVDEYLRTSVHHIYAIGDCCDSGLPLTPVGSYQSGILNGNLFGDKNRPVDYGHVPTVAFCLPPIAAVGLTAKEVRESDRNIRTEYKEATDEYHARHQNAAVYAYKLFIDEADDTIVGAHILGPKAEETVNLLYLAMRQKVSVSQFKQLMFAYPTGSYATKSMLE